MKHLKRPSPEEELAIYRRFLINLHTARWTGNLTLFNKMLDDMGDYSYARTNSNGDWEQEEQDMIRTLLNLDR